MQAMRAKRPDALVSDAPTYGGWVVFSYSLNSGLIQQGRDRTGLYFTGVDCKE